MRLFRCTQSFQRSDLAALDRTDGCDAGPDGFPFHNDGARPALTYTTAKFGAVQFEIVAEDVKQGRFGIHIDRMAMSIDIQTDYTHIRFPPLIIRCLLYTSDAADDLLC